MDKKHLCDDDGSVYMYWGTWGYFTKVSVAVPEISSLILKSLTATRLIPNTEATDFFEAPF